MCNAVWNGRPRIPETLGKLGSALQQAPEVPIMVAGRNGALAVWVLAAVSFLIAVALLAGRGSEARVRLPSWARERTVAADGPHARDGIGTASER
jgi:hypothetical protein